MHVKAVYCLLVLLAGCTQFAQVPKPSIYPYTLQQHMQAAHHWDVLAGEVVGNVAVSLMDGPVTLAGPVYVRDHDGRSPFDRAFRSFLITELRKHGVWISLEGANSADINHGNYFVINWDVQLVVHNAYRSNPPLGDVWQGTHDRPLPHSEVIITTTTTNRGVIVSRRSDIFYINDEDWQHYWSIPGAPVKTYAVVTR